MKKLLLLILSLSMATVTFSSCGFLSGLFDPSSESSSQSSSIEAPSSEKEEKVYTVTFVQDGQTVKSVEVKEGGAVAEADIPAPNAKVGYTVEWEKVDLSNITANVEVKAVATANQYTVTFDMNGGDAINPQTVTFDSEVTLPQPTRDGYTFNYWLDAEGKVVGSGKWTIADNITLKADWTAVQVNTYTITFKKTDGTVLATKTVSEGETLADIPAFPDDAGYTYAWDVTDFTNITSNMDVTLVATPNEYTITYNAGEGAIVSGDETQAVTYNSAYTLAYPTVEREGYHLVGWTAESTLPEGIWSVASNMTIHANWEINTYTITFKDGESVLYSKTVEHGAELTDIPVHTIAGYTCSWSVSDFTNITSDMEVALEKTANTYTITFDLDGGTLVSGELTQSVVFGQAYTLAEPTATKEGHTFGGWEAVGAARPLGVWTYDGNVTLKAIWNVKVPDTYDITFKTANGETYAVKHVTEGETLTDIPAFPDDAGYTYAWDVTDFTNISSDMVVNMIVTPNEYTITYNAGEGAIVSGNATQTVAYNSAYTVAYPTVERAGYHLVGWTADGTLPEGIWSVAGNMTIHANWEINTYTITFKDGESVLYIKTVEHGAELTDIPVHTIAGYTCSWSVSDFTNITSNMEVALEKTANTYTITFDLDGGTLVSGELTQSVVFNETYTLNNPVVTKAGFDFVSWVAVSGTLPTDRWTIADNMTVKATWNAKAVYTITFIQNGQAPVTFEVEAGQSLTLADIPVPATKTGYTVSWDEEGLAKLSNVQSSFSVNAVETPNTYTITYSDAKGAFTGTINFTYDAAYDLMAIEPTVTGYHFVNFTLSDGTVVPTSGNAWTIADNVTVIANWEANTYTVVLNAGSNGTCAQTQINVTYGEAYSLPTATPNDGYTFEGWKLNGTLIPMTGTWEYTAAGTIELTASWQSEEWTKNY